MRQKKIQESFHSYSTIQHNGFTLVELLVVLAIITVIMSIVITSQSSFNKSLVLTNTAYDLALTIRSAETYGIGSRALGTVSNTGYGVYFNFSSPTQLIFFADTSGTPACHTSALNDPTAPDASPGNCLYDPGSDSLINTYSLRNGVSITDFCLYTTSWFCESTRPGTLSLDIVFSRPNPTPSIGFNTSPGLASKACLVLSSSQGGSSRYILISASGAIDPNASSLSCQN